MFAAPDDVQRRLEALHHDDAVALEADVPDGRIRAPAHRQRQPRYHSARNPSEVDAGLEPLLRGHDGRYRNGRRRGNHDRPDGLEARVEGHDPVSRVIMIILKLLAIAKNSVHARGAGGGAGQAYNCSSGMDTMRLLMVGRLG